MTWRQSDETAGRPIFSLILFPSVRQEATDRFNSETAAGVFAFDFKLLAGRPIMGERRDGCYS